MARQYRDMAEAPKNGTPICIAAGGVETPAYWESALPQPCWRYFDEEEDGDTGVPVRGELRGWRPLF